MNNLGIQISEAMFDDQSLRRKIKYIPGSWFPLFFSMVLIVQQANNFVKLLLNCCRLLNLLNYDGLHEGCWTVYNIYIIAAEIRKLKQVPSRL